MADRFKACSVEGCKGNAHWRARGGNGLCSPHKLRLKRHGDPLGGRTARGELMRFIHDVAVRYEGADCLSWPFGKNENGYGIVMVSGRHAKASRYICSLVKGNPPTPEHEAAHSCGKGHLGCVNPNHLEWKTTSQNQMDRVSHGTSNRGERHYRSKITEAEVLEIRHLRGIKKQREIAEMFGVSNKFVCDIQTGKSWAWLQD